DAILPRRFAHASIHVTDLAASLRFYRDLLGLLESETHVVGRDLKRARVARFVLDHAPSWAHAVARRRAEFAYRGLYSTLCFMSCGTVHHDLVLTEVARPRGGGTVPVSGRNLRGLSFELPPGTPLPAVAQRLTRAGAVCTEGARH